MPPIFVDTDNTDPNDKLFDGSKAGTSAAQAEDKMQKVVKKIVDKTPDFTTNQIAKPKGYAIRLKISKIEIDGRNTKCSLSGSIVRYPPTPTKTGPKGEEMVSTSMTGNAAATGIGDAAILDCVEAVAEDLATKSVPIMRQDFAKR